MICLIRSLYDRQYIALYLPSVTIPFALLPQEYWLIWQTVGAFLAHCSDLHSFALNGFSPDVTLCMTAAAHFPNGMLRDTFSGVWFFICQTVSLFFYRIFVPLIRKIWFPHFSKLKSLCDMCARFLQGFVCKKSWRRQWLQRPDFFSKFSSPPYPSAVFRFGLSKLDWQEELEGPCPYNRVSLFRRRRDTSTHGELSCVKTKLWPLRFSVDLGRVKDNRMELY